MNNIVPLWESPLHDQYDHGRTCEAYLCEQHCSARGTPTSSLAQDHWYEHVPRELKQLKQS